MILVQELTALDSEIASLIALIEAKRQQQEVLTAAENLASEAMSRLTQALSCIGEVAPSAIASLKSAVLGLFAEQPLSSNSSDFEKIKTVSAEQPQNFTPGSIIVDEVDSLGIVIGTNNQGMSVDWLGIGSYPNPASGKGVWYGWAKDNQAIASFSKSTHDRVKLFSTEEFLQFQDWDSDQLDDYWDGKWVSDYGCQYRWGGATINRWIVVIAESCEWASPFASPLACSSWKDAPLTGQHCTIIPSTTEDNKNKSTKEGEDMPKPPSTEMVHLSANCGYLKLKADGRILAAYCWFSRKNIAEAWMQQIEVIPTASVEMRESQRNSSWKWELKVTGLSMTQIERLAKEALHQKPKKETPAQAAGIEPPSDWGKPQIKEVPYQFGIGDVVNWNGCKLRVAAVGVETLHCVLQSDPDGTRPHTKVPIAECVLVEEGLNVGDKVEINSDRYLGAKGKEVIVNAVLTTAELPIGVELPNGNTRYFPRNELKFIAKAPSQQQQLPTELQAGTVLMGNRIVTTGNYTGLARRNAINNARTGLQDKLAVIELVKAGVSREEAIAAVTLSTTASDDYDF